MDWLRSKHSKSPCPSASKSRTRIEAEWVGFAVMELQVCFDQTKVDGKAGCREHPQRRATLYDEGAKRIDE